MNQKELKELVEFLIEKDISEFELERGDVKVKIKRGGDKSQASAPDSRYFTVHAAPPPAPEGGTGPTVPPQQPAAPVKAPAVEENLHMVRSPIVGTVRRVAFTRLPALCKGWRRGRSGASALNR